MSTSNKKLLAIVLIISFFTSSLPTFLVNAQIDKSEYFRVYNSSTTPSNASKQDSTLINVINRSGNDYFVPNKTLAEFNSFRDNPPRYVSVEECGDRVCSELEAINKSCPDDCPGFAVAEGCGDGVCKQSLRKVVLDPPGIPDPTNQICDPDHAGFIAVGIWATVFGTITGCFLGGPIGCFIGAMATALPSGALITATKCQSGYIREIAIPTGEVYATTTEAVQNNVPQTACPADCAASAVIGCGVCGFNSQGQQCPNWCNGGGYNQENCVYRAPTTLNSSEPSIVFENKNILKKYLTASEASAILDLGSNEYISTERYDFRDEAGYSCNYGGSTANLCPAGRYCAMTKGLKPGISLTSYLPSNVFNDTTAPPCPAGSFCPVGSSYPRPCPPNTYSTGGAEKCTNCPVGTKNYGVIGSTAASDCVDVFFAKDKRCSYEKENPTNSPYDCPDDRSKEAGSPQLQWYGDGHCTGVESGDPLSSFYSTDCFCGNDSCDADESPSSCYYDCYCMDSICGNLRLVELGSGYNPYETKTCKYRGGVITNKSNCSQMNQGENCGNGVCEPGEMHKSGYGIICPRDCSCGNGYCEENKGEFYSPTSAAGSCNADCQCGNGTCDLQSPFNEDYRSCLVDCHCGNDICEEGYEETAYLSSCPQDCRCGDNICSPGENSTSCSQDCSVGCNKNNICDIGETYDCSDCRAALPY